MDALVELAHDLDEEIFVQAGHTPFGSGLTCESFLSPIQLRAKIDEASLVISQGGFGSMSDVLSAGKPLVAVPRSIEHGEANGEQSDLVKLLEDMDVLVPVYEMPQLPVCVQQARERTPISAPQSEIPKQLAATVSEWLK